MPTAEEILTIPEITEPIDRKFAQMGTIDITDNTKKITELPDNFEPDSDLPNGDWNL